MRVGGASWGERVTSVAFVFFPSGNNMFGKSILCACMVWLSHLLFVANGKKAAGSFVHTDGCCCIATVQLVVAPNAFSQHHNTLPTVQWPIEQIPRQHWCTAKTHRCSMQHVMPCQPLVDSTHLPSYTHTVTYKSHTTKYTHPSITTHPTLTEPDREDCADENL